MSWWRLQLVKFKLDSSSPVKRKRAVEELAQLDTADTVRMLVQLALADEDKDVREAAGLALKQLARPESVKLLLGALESEELRDVAIEALARMPALAAAPLMDEYASCEHDVRRAILKTVVQMGQAAVPLLTGIMKDGNLVVRTAAKEALRDIGHDPDHLASEPPRKPPTEIARPSERSSTAPPALDEQDAEEQVQAAIKALMNPEMEVRLEAVHALRDVGDPRAMKLLTAALQDVHGAVRSEAVAALSDLGWEPKNEKQRALRAVAAGRLSEAVVEGVAAVPPLITLLQDETAQNRDDALEALIGILEQHGGEMELEDLRAVAQFPDLRDRAQTELLRRGQRG